MVYYKDIINPKLEDKKYLSNVARFEKKIIIAKIRTNSHDTHTEIGKWTRPKTPWEGRIFKVYILTR